MNELLDLVARKISGTRPSRWNEMADGYEISANDLARAALTATRDYLAANGWTSAIIDEAIK